MSTSQQNMWAGKFGKEYTIRNSFIDKGIFNFDDWNNLLLKEIGLTRTDLNELFFRGLEAQTVLEVGSNVGLQLNCFEKMNLFSKYYGVELQRYAISKSREMFPTAAFDIVEGSAEEIPFKDACCDLVMTNGVLIHIPPHNINKVLEEVYRCSKKYIFGYEYYQDEYSEKKYVGIERLLWRGNFCSMYLNKFSDLKIVKQKRWAGAFNDSKIYDVFLLEK